MVKPKQLVFTITFILPILLYIHLGSVIQSSQSTLPLESLKFCPFGGLHYIGRQNNNTKAEIKDAVKGNACFYDFY